VADVLIYADSIKSPEMRHEVPLAVPDPFLYLEREGRRIAVASSLELPRIRAAAPDLEVRPPEDFGFDELLAEGMERSRVWLEVACRAVERAGVEHAVVPGTFPLELADYLRERGIEVRPDRQLFDGRRRVKNAAEIEGIRRAQRACEAALDASRELLRRAAPANGGLVADGQPLSCERLKVVVERVFSEHGCAAEEFIVSHGAQTAVGHDMGSGPIAPGEPICFDLFPRDRETGVYSDMTRVYVVGDVPEELREYHRLCKQALDEALAATRPGVTGAELMRATCELFERHGYPTQLSKQPGEVLENGFFHSLGHGIGLEVHEEPGLGRGGGELVAGDVVTLEPGLYRAGWGGVRLEDIVLVTEDGCENLAGYPYEMEP
jgi:Xaa-Pro aminopeptidase